MQPERSAVSVVEAFRDLGQQSDSLQGVFTLITAICVGVSGLSERAFDVNDHTGLVIHIVAYRREDGHGIDGMTHGARLCHAGHGGGWHMTRALEASDGIETGRKRTVMVAQTPQRFAEERMAQIGDDSQASTLGPITDELEPALGI